MARIKKDVPYVFIHPAWRGAWCWDRVLEIMRSWGREAYAVDCPGHGERIHEMETATLAGYPKAVIEFIEQHNLNRVVLIGNSTGGLINQLVAQEI
ncbi:MAG: alpha/beta fold hydrolase, partial [Candidatus Binataceae bacterium]